MTSPSRKKWWISVSELIIASILVIRDVFIPTLSILVLMCVSFVAKKQPFSSLGFKKDKNVLRTVITIFCLSIIWSLFHLSVTMPLLNHLTGTTQNLSSFATLKGNLNQLIIFLVATWTLAAFGEEIVYRGYIQQKCQEIFSNYRWEPSVTILISSILFGIAHTEQGIIGVIITFLDAVFVSILKKKYHNNLWAPVLAHGFNNTVGLITFYFTGPLYGFW